MEMEIFVENFRQQFVDSEKIEMTIDTEFRKIDSYDSLTAMTIMVMLEDEYGVKISDADFKAKKTLRELYEYVVNCR